MGYFACRAPASDGTRTLLEALDFQGRIAFDHFHEADGQLNFALTSDELEVVRAHGLDPEIVEDLEMTAASNRADRASLDADDNDDALATGFVDQYLDADGVAARINAISCTPSHFPVSSVIRA